MTERMPQRFRWKDTADGPWAYGVCMPGNGMWHVRAGAGHGSFIVDPWENLGHIIGDVAGFEWVDNDFGWPGPMMPKAARTGCDECGSQGPQGLYDGKWLCVECAE
jgi:hypothetical protein